VPPRGGTGKSPRGRGNAHAGLATGVTSVRETPVEQGCCLTVACGVRSTLHAGGSRVHETWASGVGSRNNVARRLASRIRTRYRACPAACGAATDRILNRGGASSEGEEAQESNGSAIPPWPGLRDRNRERTPGGSKASKRACRSLTRRAQCRRDGRFEQTCLRACPGGRSSDRRETAVPAHASTVLLREGRSGKELAPRRKRP